MKRIFITLTFCALVIKCPAQFRSFGLIAGGGVSIVDVSQVVQPNELYDWNTYSLVFKGFADYKIGEGNAIGIEAGTNRLYFWKYPAPGYSWYNFRTEWTTNAVIYFQKQLGDRFYLQSGAGLHMFKTGTVLGILGAFGTSFYITENLTIPVFLRVEPIFGNSTPIAINFGTGIRYNLIK
jgi:hypothetical protein